jgi:hypothetical protein
MSEVKEKLINYILKEDISSIQIMSRRLSLDQEEVREILDQLVGDGEIIGYINKDGTRFFRHDLKQPKKESIALDEYTPDSNGFDTRPGIIISLVGIIVLGVSSMFYTSPDPLIAFPSTIAMLSGFVMFLSGCYCVSMKRSPV